MEHNYDIHSIGDFQKSVLLFGRKVSSDGNAVGVPNDFLTTQKHLSGDCRLFSIHRKYKVLYC